MSQTFKNLPYRFVQLHAHYRDGKTVCITLARNENGDTEAREFVLDGFDLTKEKLQEGHAHGALVHPNVKYKIFPA